jgi:hypothetical protein
MLKQADHVVIDVLGDLTHISIIAKAETFEVSAPTTPIAFYVKAYE